MNCHDQRGPSRASLQAGPDCARKLGSEDEFQLGLHPFLHGTGPDYRVVEKKTDSGPDFRLARSRHPTGRGGVGSPGRGALARRPATAGPPGAPPKPANL